MEITKSTLIAITIILFAIGAWPIAVLTAVAALALSEVISYQRRKQFEELEAKIENLTKKLEGEQAVRRAMDKAEHRKTNQKEETET